MIARIERVPLQEVWRHEAYGFTTWPEENLDVLNDATGLELSDAEREKSAGSFSVDLVARDKAGATAIIEHQLERNDHDHLGKMITYMSSMDAQNFAFYLLKVEAKRNGTPDPAPLLTVIVEPSGASRAIGETRRELADRHHERRAFWARFLDYAKARTSLHENLSPTYEAWLGTGARTRVR